MSSLRNIDQPIDLLEGDVSVSLFFEDLRPLSGPAAVLDERLEGAFARLLHSGAAEGRAGEQVLIRGWNRISSPWALFVGGGSWYGLSEETLQNLFRYLLRSCLGAGFRRIALGLELPGGMDLAAIQALLQSSLTDLPENIECLLATGRGERMAQHLGSGLAGSKNENCFTRMRRL